MVRNTFLASLMLIAGVLCLTGWAQEPGSPPKAGKSDSTPPAAQSPPGAGMMGKGMMGKGMMGGPMIPRGMKMMQMHKKMQEEMNAMDAETDKLVTEMNQATGQKKIDAMAALLTRLVAQRKMMNEKMGAMHTEMMQAMMGIDTAPEPAAKDKNGATEDHSEHAQPQH